MQILGKEKDEFKDSLAHQLILRKDMKKAVMIIKDRFYFLPTHCPIESDIVHMFTIDKVLRYEPFFVDFGPLDLGHFYKFYKLVEHKLDEKKNAKKKIIYFCDKNPQRISNACYLIGCYQILKFGKNPVEVFEPLKHLASEGVPFRDASMGLCLYQCKVEDCLWAFFRCIHHGFFSLKTFDVDEYEHFEKVENGDLNIIVPGKFIAFAGPYFKNIDEEGYPALTADFYLPIFEKYNVKCVIRLNKKRYDRNIFLKAGIEHHDLYFTDGTTPDDKIVKEFLQICENFFDKKKGMIAVHCKAGLGRTGTLIGCYLMKFYMLNAREVIAWIRICRPGSIIGPQQHYLVSKQEEMWKAGLKFRKDKGKVMLKSRDPRITNKNTYMKEYNLMRETGKSSKEKGYDFVKSAQKKLPKNGNILPTDPGQNQGAVLKEAKYKVQHRVYNNENKNNNNNTSDIK